MDERRKKTPEEMSAIKKLAQAYRKLKLQKLDEMEPDDIFKKALNTPPPKGNEDNITPPIQITFLNGIEVIEDLELSNQDFFKLLKQKSGIEKFNRCRLTFDDGENSYTFILDVDEFTPNKTETGKPMK